MLAGINYTQLWASFAQSVLVRQESVGPVWLPFESHNQLWWHCTWWKAFDPYINIHSVSIACLWRYSLAAISSWGWEDSVWRGILPLWVQAYEGHSDYEKERQWKFGICLRRPPHCWWSDARFSLWCSLEKDLPFCLW